MPVLVMLTRPTNACPCDARPTNACPCDALPCDALLVMLFLVMLC